MNTHREAMTKLLLERARNLDDSVSYMKQYLASCDSYPPNMTHTYNSLMAEQSQAWNNYYALTGTK